MMTCLTGFVRPDLSLSLSLALFLSLSLSFSLSLSLSLVKGKKVHSPRGGSKCSEEEGGEMRYEITSRT